MFKNRRSLASTLKIGLLMVLACVTLGWANVPPPPVNQNLGIPDSTFNNLNKLNCAYCHAPEKLSAEDRAQIGWTFEAPTMKDGIIADRHHLRVVKGMIMSEHTQAPFGEPGQPYECFSCHKIENGEMDRVDNPLKNAPHTDKAVISSEWNHKYTREVAAFPFEYSKEHKYWPSVGRVDNAYGDRNLVCSCLPTNEYSEE